MGKPFRDSLEALQADIQHANTLALDYPREKDGARLQMRLSYCPAANFFLFPVQWTDCHLARALGLLRILIYMTYPVGKTTMSAYERKASIRELWGRMQIVNKNILVLQELAKTCNRMWQRYQIIGKKRRKKDNGRNRQGEIPLLPAAEVSMIEQ